VVAGSVAPTVTAEANSKRDAATKLRIHDAMTTSSMDRGDPTPRLRRTAFPGLDQGQPFRAFAPLGRRPAPIEENRRCRRIRRQTSRWRTACPSVRLRSLDTR
jgi:hypothetical protein